MKMADIPDTDDEDMLDDQMDNDDLSSLQKDVYSGLKARAPAGVRTSPKGPVVPIYSDRPNPAELGWPATLPLEIALHNHPVKVVCEAYGIDRERWNQLKEDPLFIADVQYFVDELKKDGMSFKLKARLQSEELLKTAWKMIHDAVTPAPVRADLLKFVVRVAGLDASKDQANAAQLNQNALQININL